MIKDDSGLGKFSRSFPTFSDQAAFKDFAGHLAGGDLNCLVHRNFCRPRKFGVSLLLHLTLLPRPFLIPSKCDGITSAIERINGRYFLLLSLYQRFFQFRFDLRVGFIGDALL